MSQEQDRAAPGEEPETQPLVRPSIHRLISREEAQTNEDSGNEADQSSAPSTPPMRAQSHEASPANEPRPWTADVANSSSAEPVASDDEAILKLRRASTPEASVESSAPSIPETTTGPQNYCTALVTPHDEAENPPARDYQFEWRGPNVHLQPLEQIRQDVEQQQSRPNHDRRVSDDNPPSQDYVYEWRGRNVHLVPREQIRKYVEQQQARPNHDRHVSDDNPLSGDYLYEWRGRNVHLVPREQIRQYVEQQQARWNQVRNVSDDNSPSQDYVYEWRGRNVHLVPREQTRQYVEQQQARWNHDRHVSDDNPPSQDYVYEWRGRNVHLVPREQTRQYVEQKRARLNHDTHVSSDVYHLRGPNVQLVTREQIRQDVELQARPNHDRPIPDNSLPVQQYDLRGQNVQLVPPEQIRHDVEQPARSKNDEHIVRTSPRWWDEFFKKLRENWKTVLIFVIFAVLIIYLIKLTHFESKMKLEKLPDRHDDNDTTPGARNWWGPAPPM